jgi:hypothetical protein
MTVIAFSGTRVQGHSPLPTPAVGRELRLTQGKHLTFGDQNAEAYFSRDRSKRIFQSTPPPRVLKHP